MLSSHQSIPLFDIETGEENDRLRIFLAMDDLEAITDVADADIERYMKRIEGTDEYEWKKEQPEEILTLPEVKIDKTIMIIGYNEKFRYIVAEFRKYFSNGLKLCVAYTNRAEKEQIERYAGDVEIIDFSDISNDELILKHLIFVTDVLVLSADHDETIKDRVPLMIWNLVQRNNIHDKHFYIEVLEPQNCDIIKVDDVGGNIFLSNRYVSGMCSQLGTDSHLYKALMEMLTMKSSKNIWTYPAGELFRTNEELSFISKKEAILWTYIATQGYVVLMGIVRDGVSYMFTNNMKIGDLEDCDLFPRNLSTQKILWNETLVIKPTDRLIVLDKGEADKNLIRKQ